MAYEPTSDYNAAYDAAKRRITENFARRRGQLTQDLASRGVSTSGVASIPGEEVNRAEGGELSNLAGNFALEQANTGIEDRRAAQAFERQRELMGYGSELQDALNRRLARQQLQGQIIGGLTGAVGSAASGYMMRPAGTVKA